MKSRRLQRKGDKLWLGAYSSHSLMGQGQGWLVLIHVELIESRDRKSVV